MMECNSYDTRLPETVYLLLVLCYEISTYLSVQIG